MKRCISIILFVTILFCSCVVFADEASPCADEVFISATASLATGKYVTYSFVTQTTQNTIQLELCWLQVKQDGVWMWGGSLPVPTAVGTNTHSFATVMDYASYIGTGTYRVGFRVNADGHTIIRYSNERTF